mgnify:FL=1
MRAMRTWLGVLLLSLLLVGCGFSLKRSAPLSPALAELALDPGAADAALVEGLTRELGAAGATLKPLNAPGVSVLTLSDYALRRDVVSVDERAKVGEYELHLKLSYAVSDAEGAALLKPTPLELSRVYSFDEQQALAAAQEEEVLRRELIADAVAQIIERLQRVQAAAPR